MLVNNEVSRRDLPSSVPPSYLRQEDNQGAVQALSEQLGRNYAVYAQAAQSILAQQQGLPLTAFKALEFLLTFGPLPTGQLAHLTGLSHGGIAALLSRLEAANLITRDRHPDDRRIVAIRANRERCAHFLFPMEYMKEIMTEVSSSYSSRELSIVSSFLEDCAKQLHAFNAQQLNAISNEG